MAQGSQKFSWKLFGDVPHICWSCGRDLKIQDVAEHRKVYPSQRTEFLCVTCRDEKTERLVQSTRARLGLGEKGKP